VAEACPRCGYPAVADDKCPQCHVVVSLYQASLEKLGEKIDFLARPLARLPLSVFLPDGTVPQRAQIQWRRDGEDVPPQKHLASWSLQRRILDLRPGTYVLRATCGELEELRSVEVSVLAKPGSSNEEIVLRLEKRLGITGRVLFPKGVFNAAPGTTGNMGWR